MISDFTALRLASSVRRLAKAMERANELELHRQDVEHPPLKDAGKKKKTVFSRPTIDEWNDKVKDR